MNEEEKLLWYCVKARPRRERAARASLQSDVGVEVFCPLLRFERARSSGRVRVTEAMFPGYVFARFSYPEFHRRVATANAVSTIISFGGVPAVVPDGIIAELRASVEEGETVEIPTTLSVGEEVNVIEGPFQGIRAVITKVLPARARVKVLLELLGMEREVEVAEGAVMPDIQHPLAPPPN